MRIIHVLLFGNPNVEEIRRLDFSSWTNRPISTDGLDFVGLKLFNDSYWLSVRGDDESLLKFVCDFEPDEWDAAKTEMPASWPEEMKGDYYLSSLEKSPKEQVAEVENLGRKR